MDDREPFGLVRRFGATGKREALDQLLGLAEVMVANQGDIFPEDLQELDHLLALLRYHAHPVKGWEVREQLYQDIMCEAKDCSVDWAVEDGCLLNINGRWLCRDHQPELADGRVRPVGWQPPVSEREQLLASRRDALAKVSREELRLLNARIGG